MSRLDAASWQRVFGLLGLALVFAGAWLKDLDTGAVVIIVGFFMGGNAAIKVSSNVATGGRRKR